MNAVMGAITVMHMLIVLTKSDPTLAGAYMAILEMELHVVVRKYIAIYFDTC